MNKIINMTMLATPDIGALSFLPDEACIWRDSHGKLKSFVGSMIYVKYDMEYDMDHGIVEHIIEYYDNLNVLKDLVNDILSGRYTEEELLDILPATIVDDNGDESDQDDSCLKLRDIDDTDMRERIIKGIHKAIIDNMI